LRVKPKDDGFYYPRTEGLFTKNHTRRGIGHSRPSNLRATAKIRSGRADARVRTRARANQRARVVSGLGRDGLTSRPQLHYAGERVRGERSDPNLTVGIRSGLIEIRSSD
jgi:hypothetical protein